MRTAAVAVAALLFAAPAVAQLPADSGYRHAVEFSPVSPLIRIWAVQFALPAGDRSELLLGGAYTNVKYDHGQSHAPTAIAGYRRYLWRGAHLEYQLWPSYNHYYEFDEQRYYDGFELWNEFRPGYTFSWRAGERPVFVNVQMLLGFALYGGNKPQSFKDQAAKEKVFVAPMIFTGWRF